MTGNFEHSGPSLHCTYSKSHANFFLKIGVTLLDVKVGAQEVKYKPAAKSFDFHLRYPRKFLGATKPISWSENGGFRINSWHLGSLNVPGISDELARQFKQLANVPTSKKCASISNFIFHDAIDSKFSVSMKTCDENAFLITGTYNISIGGKLRLKSIPLPPIKINSGSIKTMSELEEYVLQMLASNAGSMVQQILDNPAYLEKVVAALAFDQLQKQAEVVINSLVCRGISQKAIASIGKVAEDGATSVVKEATEAMKSVEKALKKATGSEAFKEAQNLLSDIDVVDKGLDILAKTINFFGGKSSKKSEKIKRKREKAERENGNSTALKTTTQE